MNGPTREILSFTITDLNEYDEDGHEYTYTLIERQVTGYGMPSYKTVRDETTGDYETTVTNAPGEGNYIMVAKSWIDDSDVEHREPVTVTVYDRDDNKKIDSVTMDSHQWHAYVGIEEKEPEDVYILETAVGKNNKIPLQSYLLDSEDEPSYDANAPTEYSGTGDGDHTCIQYTTDDHRYEVVYTSTKIEGLQVYTVVNRRLGTIDYTVTKKWVDGAGANAGGLRAALQNAIEEIKKEDGTELIPALKLELSGENAASYEITYNSFQGEDGSDSGKSGDTVTLGSLGGAVPIQSQVGSPAAAYQPISLEKDSSDYYFFNLPKYDDTGAAVSYSVKEVWLKTGQDGKLMEMTKDKVIEEHPGLKEFLADYGVSYELTDYQVGDHHTKDEQKAVVKTG